MSKIRTNPADTGTATGEPAASAATMAVAEAAAPGTTTVATEGPVAAAVEKQAAARTGEQGATKTASKDRRLQLRKRRIPLLGGKRPEPIAVTGISLIQPFF